MTIFMFMIAMKGREEIKKKKRRRRKVQINTWLHLTRITASNPWGLVMFHLRSLYNFAGSESAENG